MCPTFAFAEATLSLKAVAKNGVPITPTNSLNISPNDVVTADIFLSGWNNPPFDGGSGMVATYQVTLAGQQGVFSSHFCTDGCNSFLVVPRGWDAPIVKNPCPCEDPCYPTCDVRPSYGCVGPNFHPEQMASINRTRQDYIFREFDGICSVDVSSLDIRWGCTINGSDGQTASRCAGGIYSGFSCTTNADCPQGICDPNYSSFLGTLYLKAGSSVCGTFTFTLVNDILQTFIANPYNLPVTVLPRIEGLVLSVSTNPTCPLGPPGACCDQNAGRCVDLSCGAHQCEGRWVPLSTCASLDPPCLPHGGACCINGICTNNVLQTSCIGQSGQWGGLGSTCATFRCIDNVPISTSPSPCSIDARRPYPPNQPAQREGFNSFTWTFSSPPTSTEDAPNDFTIRQVPSTTPPIPPTISSVTPVGNNLTFNLSGPIQPNHWYCVKRNADSLEKCLGYLPGDADSNRGAVPADLIRIIDNLNGLVIPPLVQYQCDIDRSGVCTPADILTEIDLLNGVTGFPVQNGKTLEPCPSAP